MAEPTVGELAERIEALSKLNVKDICWIKATMAADKAALDHRLNSMNEIRQALTDLSGTMFTRNEHDVYSTSVEKDLRALRESRAELSGKASQRTAGVGLLLAVAAVVISALDLILYFLGGVR